MDYFIDTHCHMNSKEYVGQLDQYFQNAKDENVLLSNVICLNKQEYLYTLQMKREYNIDISFGYYPEDCDLITDQDLIELEEAIKDKKIVALGEIGLDYHNEGYNKEKQIDLFIKQILLANKYHLPIIIHCRNAAQDCYEILKEYAKTNILMHCFSESNEMMQRFLKLGCYISFSGVVTFNNAKEPKLNAVSCPIDRILIETDAPYLTPVPHRGKMNQTAYVKYVGQYIAEIRGIKVEELNKHVIENYQRFKDGKN